MNSLVQFIAESFAERRQIRRFFFTGLFNATATFLLYQILLLALSYEAAYSASYIAGILLSYVAHAKFTFTAKVKISGAVGYVLLSLFNYCVGLVLLIFCVETLRVHQAIAPILVLSIVVPMSFLLTRALLIATTNRP